MNVPDIQFENPLKECVDVTGQRQSGKSELIKQLLRQNPNPVYIFDTLGVISQNFQALHPHQRIFNPKWSDQALPSYEERLTVFLPICDQIWRRGNIIFVIRMAFILQNKVCFASPIRKPFQSRRKPQHCDMGNEPKSSTGS